MKPEIKTFDIPLHELPRDIRLWLCQHIGWKEPVHFGYVRIWPNSTTMKELQERLRAHKERLPNTQALCYNAPR